MCKSLWVYPRHADILHCQALGIENVSHMTIKSQINFFYRLLYRDLYRDYCLGHGYFCCIFFLSGTIIARGATVRSTYRVQQYERLGTVCAVPSDSKWFVPQYTVYTADRVPVQYTISVQSFFFSRGCVMNS